MDKILETIHAYEAQIEGAHADLERPGRLSEALAAYEAIEGQLARLEMLPVGRAHPERGRVLSTCLGRQAEILRQLGRVSETEEVAVRQLAAARQAGDLLTLAHALLSSGAARLRGGDPQGGGHALEEARRLFESGDTVEHKRGLGEYWINRAELLNEGALPGGASAAIHAADQALAALEPIEDHQGVARAHAARAKPR